MFGPVALFFALNTLPMLVGQPRPEPRDDFWVLVATPESLWGGVRGARFVGTFLTALVKRATYRRSVTVSTSGVTLWQVASAQWRVEKWLGYLVALAIARSRAIEGDAESVVLRAKEIWSTHDEIRAP